MRYLEYNRKVSKDDSPRLCSVHTTFTHSSFFVSLHHVPISLRFVSVSLGPLRPYMPTSCFIYSSLHVSCNPSSYLWPSIPILIFLYKYHTLLYVCSVLIINQVRHTLIRLHPHPHSVPTFSDTYQTSS